MSGTTMNEDLAAGGLPRGVVGPSGRGGRFLSDVIVELGFAERETVEQALEASRAPGKKLGATLVEMGILSEHQLGQAVAERYRLDYLDLEEFDVDPEAVRVIGDKEMKSYEAAPVAFTEDGALVVAMVDPADWLAAEEIAQLTGRRVRRAVASATGVARLIARVAEAKASVGESTGDAAQESAPAPLRLTLRRVANPLTGGAPPPTPSTAPPGLLATSPEHQAPRLADAYADAGSSSEEGARAEEPTVDSPEDGSPTPAYELAAPEAVVGTATGRSTESPEERVHGGLGTEEEEARLTPSGGDGAQVQMGAGEEPAKAGDSETDTPSGIEVAGPRTEVAEAPVEVAAEATGAIEPPPRGEVAAGPDRVTGDLELDQVRPDLAATRAELEGTRAERARFETELQTTRSELANTRGELTSARGRLETALKRAADAEHGLAEARADVSRLEAELAAARDQAKSLRADVSWARQQIEQKTEREDHALADLRERIEAMQAPAPPPAPAEPLQPGPPSARPTAPPVLAPASAPGSNGAEPPPNPTPVSANGHPESVPPPEPEHGTAKARGLKRLIAAVRRL